MQINYIYHIRDAHQAVIYVGQTIDPNRRLREHWRVFGKAIDMEILESDPSDVAEAERRWIAHYRAAGAPLRNVANGGKDHASTSDATREKLSKIGRGKPKPAGQGEKLRAATKGKPHNWTLHGLENATRTQFKPGVSTYAGWSDEEKARHRERMRRRSASLSDDERSRRSTKAWAGYTPEQRAIRNANISAGMKRSARIRDGWRSKTPEQQAQIAAKVSATKMALRAERLLAKFTERG